MIIVCGEALIDFMPVRAEGSGKAAYQPVPGGSGRNIATGIGRLGAKVGFMGGISTDFFGAQIAEAFRSDAVLLDYAPTLEAPSTLAFVKLGGGEPAYAFFDERTAHQGWTRSASPEPAEDVTALHFGSLTLIAPPLADECLALMRAQDDRRLISIDPNCRPSLTHDLPAYRARMRTMLGLADIVKLSLADLEYLQPGVAPETAARGWIAQGTRLVMLTRGGDGARAWTRHGAVSVPAQPVQLVDTVGAGDSFIAAALVHLDRAGLLSVAGLDRLTPGDAEAALAFAVRAAGITCSRIGADPPWLRELSADRS